MTVQLSLSVRNAMLDAIEAAIGTSAILKIRTGSAPATCAAADAGTVLATVALGVDWMSAAAAGSKTVAGLPLSDLSADAGGTAGHFRIYASDGVTCHWQGSVTATSGGGDMTVSTTSFALGQRVDILSLAITAGNA